MKRTAREQIHRAPESPGVYLLKGEGGKVLYVGKAKRLKDRLRWYLNPSSDERPSVSLLVPRVASVEWLLTDNEKEALLLENSLIKSHRPRYNIMLRDDKSYVSLRLTDHAFPRLFITRKIVRDGSHYFGPYSSSRDLRQTLTLVQKLFMVRDCSDPFFRNRSRPCLQHQIRRCTAPCVGTVTEKDYSEQVQAVKMFLSGEKSALLSDLKAKMNSCSEAQNYEEAGVVRDRIGAVEKTLEPQKVESRRDEQDADAIGLAGDHDATLLKVLKIRRGRMVAADEFFVEEPIHAASEIVRAFLQQYYLADAPVREIPRQLILAAPIADAKVFESLLGERDKTAIRIRVPKRGKAVRLLRLAERNAASSLAERKRISEQNRGVLEELRRKLKITGYPRRIEGYDISAFHGADPVGSMVVFIDGEPDKTEYRHYRIRTVKGSNDFAMLQEMFERRFRKLSDENRPDLVLVDGGKGQLRQLTKVLHAFGVKGLFVASLAKEKELRSRSGKRYAPERIFLPGRKNPIVFPSSSKVLHLLQRVRDEAHRFGITRHRQSRKRTTLTSLLSRIPGVGLKRQKVLLKHFKSLEYLRAAPLEELEKIAGISATVAKEIHNFFRKLQEPQDE